MSAERPSNPDVNATVPPAEKTLVGNSFDVPKTPETPNPAEARAFDPEQTIGIKDSREVQKAIEKIRRDIKDADKAMQPPNDDALVLSKGATDLLKARADAEARRQVHLAANTPKPTLWSRFKGLFGKK